jgi:hypothetical protein
MMLVIDTQYMENYGAHDWDGEGECPQYWKMKGGSSYKVLGVPVGIDLQEVIEVVTPEVERSNEYCREYIIGFRSEADDYLSEFEQSQLEYEGKITHKEPTLAYGDLVDRAMA